MASQMYFMAQAERQTGISLPMDPRMHMQVSDSAMKVSFPYLFPQPGSLSGVGANESPRQGDHGGVRSLGWRAIEALRIVGEMQALCRAEFIIETDEIILL